MNKQKTINEFNECVVQRSQDKRNLNTINSHSNIFRKSYSSPMFNVQCSVFSVLCLSNWFRVHCSCYILRGQFWYWVFEPMRKHCLNIIEVVVFCIHNRRMLHATFLKYNLLANRANRSPSLQQIVIRKCDGFLAICYLYIVISCSHFQRARKVIWTLNIVLTWNGNWI